MKIITLTTDFGYGDFGIGQMRGAIWKIAPEARIIDLTNDINPQDVNQAALILGRTTPNFPTGTIHVVVVDPGVGTQRRPIAAQLGSQYFVGPDNGVFSLMLENGRESGGPIDIIHLDKPQYWLENVTSVFHGRDIFSPVAGYIAAGTPLDKLGSPIQDTLLLEVLRAARTEQGWDAQVIYIDSFGNLQVNLRKKDIKDVGEIIFQIGQVKIQGMVNTFGERPKGELVALIDSFDHLCISIVNGSAAKVLNSQVGDTIKVTITHSKRMI
jgi:S-adenosyl-L-methionine hydrolase (adenosine-forming)